MKIIRIAKCFDCLHCFTMYPPQCKLSGRHITDPLDNIPEWCELDDLVDKVVDFKGGDGVF